MPTRRTEAMYACTKGAAQGAWRSRSGMCLAPCWVAPLYPLLGLCLRPWIVYVAWLLPSRSASSRWDVAWVGVDAGLFAALAATDGRPGGMPGGSRWA